jgi:hypothetical protein
MLVAIAPAPMQIVPGLVAMTSTHAMPAEEREALYDDAVKLPDAAQAVVRQILRRRYPDVSPDGHCLPCARQYFWWRTTIASFRDA